MKNIKFKNTNLFNKYKLLFSIFLTIMLVLFFSHKINMMISTNVQDYLVAKVKKENLLLLKDVLNRFVLAIDVFFLFDKRRGQFG